MPQVQTGEGDDCKYNCFEETEGHCISYMIDFSRGKAWSKDYLPQDWRSGNFHSCIV